MTPATRLPLRKLPRPSVILTTGLAVAIVSIALSVAGLPDPAGMGHVAGDRPSGAPSAAPPARSPDPVGNPPASSPSAAKRHAPSAWDLCARGPRDLEPAAVRYHGPRDQKVVALTFDDGWGRSTTRKILRILQDKRVNATFFPVGQAVRHDPETWRKVAAAGFPIADHTYDHATLAKECYLAQRRELTRARATYARILGVSSLPVIRPPGGEWDAATRAAAAAAGEPTLVLWDVDTHDWTGIGTRQVRRNALDGTKGSIVVLHTSSRSTVRALPRIIRTYRKRGFELVTIGQLLGIPGAVPFPPSEDD